MSSCSDGVGDEAECRRFRPGCPLAASDAGPGAVSVCVLRQHRVHPGMSGPRVHTDPSPAFAGEGEKRDYTAMRVTESLQLE